MHKSSWIPGALCLAFADNDGIPDAIEASHGVQPNNYIAAGVNTGRIGGAINANGRPQSSLDVQYSRAGVHVEMTRLPTEGR